MDWKKTFNRGNWIIHSIFATAILLALASTFYALRLNHLQSTEEERTQKISSILEKLKVDDSFGKIGKFLSKAQPDSANDKLRELSGLIAEIEELLEVNVSSDLSHSINLFLKLINHNSGISSPTDILKVLNQKINSLKDYADSNKYKNVALISERMQVRLQQVSSARSVNAGLVSNLKFDLNKLDSLITSSTLKDNEKNILLNKISGMRSEIELLLNISTHFKDLDKKIKESALALGQWIIDSEKKINDSKNIYKTKQNQLLILMASFVAFLLLGWLAAAYLFRWQKIKISEQVESEVELVIEKGILADQRFMVEHYSDKMRETIVKLLDELKIKLNLGTMLYDGLPFAGCLIDNSFKLTWYNNLFLDQFHLSEQEITTEDFKWNDLKLLFNLESDPVYEALVNKIAGIYAVKIKHDDLSPMHPFEMYVTPITVNREDRVMIFFYPLISVKEAINDQVNLVKDSIERFVDLWSDERLNFDEMKLLEKDFKINEISDLFENFSTIHRKLNSEKDENLKMIETLENENMNYSTILDEIKKIEEERKEIIRSEFNLAEEIKGSFINTFDKTDSLIQINKSIMHFNDDLKNEAQRMNAMAQEIMKKNKETNEILSQLEGIKTDYKKLKLELLEVKAKLVSLNSSLMAQLPPLEEQQQKLASRYKDELARLDFNVCTLDKKLSQLDVYLGKLSMMHDKVTVEQMNFNFLTTQKDHETKEALLNIQKDMATEEGEIITNFKELHLLMRQDLAKCQATTHTIKSDEVSSMLS
jgi:hypothetical protein